MANSKYTKIYRRGFEIVLPTDFYKDLKENKINIQAICKNGKLTTVQLSKNNEYLGTVKSALDVSKFKDGNAGNFRVSNIIR